MRILLSILALLTLAPQIGSASRQGHDHDEYISPTKLWHPFGRFPEVFTADLDEVKSAKISCKGTDFEDPGFELDTTKNIFSAPSSVVPSPNQPMEYIRVIENYIENFPPENDPVPSIGNPIEYLPLSMFAGYTSTEPHSYAWMGPMWMAPRSGGQVKCRWLRSFKEAPASYPATGLYCRAEEMDWHYQDFNSLPLPPNKYLGHVSKLHFFVHLPWGEPGIDSCVLNSFKMQDAKNPAESLWSYLPGCSIGNSHLTFDGLTANPLREKKLVFSNEVCTVEIENNYPEL